MKPFFAWQDAWVDKAGKIYAALERARISEEQNPDKLLLRKQGRVKSVHATTAIEGNRLSEGAVAGVIGGAAVFGPRRDILEVRNAQAAYEALDSLDPYSVESFLRAHGLLTEGLVAEAGAFRTVDVEVVRADGGVLHTGAEPEIVPRAVGQLLEWAEQTEANPLIASSAVHFMIEYIHPFRDGNGRMGRLWQTLMLSRWNELFAWLPTETLILNHQLGYYQALQASHNGHIEASPFIAYMLDIIELALNQYRTATDTTPPGAAPHEGISEGISEGRSARLDSTDRLILERLAGDGAITAAALAQAVGKSPATVERRLARLRGAGLLQRRGSKKTGRWVVVDPSPPGSRA